MSGVENPVWGDSSRQAIDSLGGYAYQIYASALAWLRLKQGETLLLEVAEDFAIVAESALKGVQVKRTDASVTLNTPSVRQAIDSFVTLSAANSERLVTLRYLTTAHEGEERAKADRIEGIGGLAYWRRVRSGAEIAPLRAKLNSLPLNKETLEYIAQRDDSRLRTELVERITWDCSQPSSTDLRQTVDDTFVEFGAEVGLPSTVSENLAAGALSKVLDMSCIAGTRALSYAEFRRLYDRYATLQVPIASLARSLTGVLGGGVQAAATPMAFERALDRLGPVALPAFVATRRKLMDDTRSSLLKAGQAWLTAGTGYGKSLLARRVAAGQGGNWVIARLRSTGSGQAARVLRQILTEIALLLPNGIVLDDLEETSDPDGRAALSAIFEFCRANALQIIVTASTPPSPELAATIGCTPGQIVRVGQLGPEDIDEVVRAANGNPDLWSRYLELASRGGHPQLVHALTFDLSHRGWPADELQTLNALLGENAQLQLTQAGVRDRLVRELEPTTRNLLYRLSVVIGRFTRGLMFEVAAVAPALVMPGELMDRLIGPWVDQTDVDAFRLSPLVNNTGQAILAPAEITAVNFACADFWTSGTYLDASQFDAIFLHGLLGRNERALTKLWLATLTTKRTNLKRIAETATFTSARLDAALYPHDRDLSGRLRLTQLLLQLADGNPSAQSTWRCLQQEIAAIDEITTQKKLRAQASVKILLMEGATDLLTNVAELISELRDTLIDIGTSSTIPNGEGEYNPVEAASFFFAWQLSEAETPLGMSRLLLDFANLAVEERSALKEAFAVSHFDMTTAVKSPWAKADKKRGFTPEPWLEAYLDLAERLLEVDERDLARASFEAAAAIADEQVRDGKRAMEIVERAIAIFGDSYKLNRTRARILFGAERFSEFLQFGEPAMLDRVCEDDVGRAFMARDVGIARARNGDWPGAAEAFEVGRMAAEECKGGDMHLMATGFIADVAIAEWESGNKVRAIGIMAEALKRLEAVDVNAGFRQLALYRLIGNSLNYMMNGGNRDLPPELTPAIFPGCNSNPNPHKELSDGMIGHIDMMWNMLAQTEFSVGPDRTICNQLAAWPADRQLLIMWPMLVQRRWNVAIETKDISEIKALASEVMAARWFIFTSLNLVKSEDLSNPQRGALAPVPAEGRAKAQEFIETDIVCAVTAIAVAGKVEEALDLLQHLTKSEVPSLATGVYETILRGIAPAESSSITLNESCALIMRQLRGGDLPVVQELFVICFRYFEATQERHRQFVAEPVRLWSAQLWAGLVQAQSFRLTTPSIAISRIHQSLETLPAGRAGLARLLLSTEPYIGIRLSEELKGILTSVSATRE